MPPTLTVRFFATARQATGRSSVAWEIPREGASVADVLRSLGASFPRLAPTLRVARIVRNGRYVEDLAEAVGSRDELSVHPPYGGG